MGPAPLELCSVTGDRKLNEEWLKLTGAYLSPGRDFPGVSSRASACLCSVIDAPSFWLAKLLFGPRGFKMEALFRERTVGVGMFEEYTGKVEEVIRVEGMALRY